MDLGLYIIFFFWIFSSSKMALILSFGFDNQFGLKVKFNQLLFWSHFKRQFDGMSLKLHQKKFLPYIFHIYKRKQNSIWLFESKVKRIFVTFLGKEGSKVWRTVKCKQCFTQTMLDKTFVTKQRNQAESDRIKSLWYLFLQIILIVWLQRDSNPQPFSL